MHHVKTLWIGLNETIDIDVDQCGNTSNEWIETGSEKRYDNDNSFIVWEKEIFVRIDDDDARIWSNRLLRRRIARLPCTNFQVTVDPSTTLINDLFIELNRNTFLCLMGIGTRMKSTNQSWVFNQFQIHRWFFFENIECGTITLIWCQSFEKEQLHRWFHRLYTTTKLHC